MVSKHRKKIPIDSSSLVIFDFDGTLTNTEYRSSWQVIHEWFDVWKPQAESYLKKFLEGKWSYEKFSLEEIKLWKGRSYQEYIEGIQQITWRNGIDELVTFLKNAGSKIVIVSAGLSEAIEPLAKKYNFDDWVGNEIIFENGKISGLKSICGWGQKGEIAKTLIAKYGVNPRKVIAIGDDSADIDVFRVVGKSIAINPSNEKVANEATISIFTENLKDLIPLFQVNRNKQ